MKVTYFIVPLIAPLIVAASLPALAEQIPLNEGHLEALDTDGDGAVSKSEYDVFADFAFEKMDRNGDSMLAPDEVDDHLVGDAFDILDDDGNGAVSEDEFLLQMNEDFATADKDGDGILN